MFTRHRHCSSRIRFEVNIYVLPFRIFLPPPVGTPFSAFSCCRKFTTLSLLIFKIRFDSGIANGKRNFEILTFWIRHILNLIHEWCRTFGPSGPLNAGLMEVYGLLYCILLRRDALIVHEITCPQTLRLT